MTDGPRPRAVRRQGVSRGAALCLVVLCAAMGAPALHAQARPGDNNRAVQITQMVDELQRGSRLEDAEQLLDVALAELRAGPEMTAVLHIRRAETRRVRQDLEAMEQDLSRAEVLLAGTTDEDLMLCNVHGIRGDAALDQGLLGIAARHFSQERTLVEKERTAQGSAPLEWYHANVRSCRLMLAREDYVDLELAVSGWLEAPAYAHESVATQRAQLRLRLAMGLRELEQNRPGRSLVAEAMLEEVLNQVPSRERPGALLRLAELRLRENDLTGARERLRQAQEALAPSHTEGLGELQGDILLLAALQARTERLGGANAETLASHSRALDEQLDRFKQTWQQRPLRDGGYGPLQFGPILALLGERMALHLGAEPSEDSLAAALSEIMDVAALGSLARSLQATVPTLHQIREQVLRGDPDHGVLVYLPTPWTTHLFLLDTSNLHHFEVARDDIIEGARRDLARKLAMAPASQDRQRQSASAEALSHMLLPDDAWPILHGWSHWSIVGTDVLGEVPFELFPVQGGGLVGELFAVDRLPSLPVATALAQRATVGPVGGGVTLLVANTPPQAALALQQELAPTADAMTLLNNGDPARPSSALTPLPVSLADAEDLLNGHAPENRLVLRGADASFEALTNSASSPQPTRVWQIIAHGISDTSRELPMGLALAPGSADDDGLVWVESARDSSPPALVILTACRAGASPLRRGDPGAADLAGAFLKAGATAVIVSPYDLSLDAVMQLSQPLHEALAQGASPAEALRRARVVMAAEGDGNGAATWASLQVVGLGQQPVLPPAPKTDSSLWWLYGAPVALAVALLARGSRRRQAA